MIFRGTYVFVIDNSGAKVAQCVGFHKQLNYGKVGSVVSVALIKVFPNKKVQRKEVYRALVVSTKSPVCVFGNLFIGFSINAVVLLKPTDLQLLGTRIVKPVSREIRQYGFVRLLGLAPRCFLFF